GVVDEVARREVVGAVDDEVVAADDLEGVGRVEGDVVAHHGDVRVDPVHRGLGRRGLGPTDVGVGVDDLPVQVGEVDDVGVDDADGADAGGREVEQRWRPEAAGAHDED